MPHAHNLRVKLVTHPQLRRISAAHPHRSHADCAHVHLCKRGEERSGKRHASGHRSAWWALSLLWVEPTVLPRLLTNGTCASGSTAFSPTRFWPGSARSASEVHTCSRSVAASPCRRSDRSSEPRDEARTHPWDGQGRRAPEGARPHGSVPPSWAYQARRLRRGTVPAVAMPSYR
jgi:hypothetical protein